MRWKKPLILTAVALLALGSWLFAVRPWATTGVELLNVSYDPTRELWQELNELFIAKHKRETGQDLTINQSHGGSGAQARAVIDGLEADVVTLALGSDTDALRRHGLLADGWQKRLPENSLPYYSTIVFVVRKGNPEKVRDWPDLVRPGVGVITPNPKTSGNGKLSFLAAWGSVVSRGGSEDDAREFVTKLYRNVPKLDTGARGSTITFARQHLGDVHLTWENEAHLEVAEAKGELEIVYPPVSIRAEPFVAVVDANVDRKGTREIAEAYLRFVYTDEAQEVLARHHYRPISKSVLQKYADRFPKLDLFSIKVIARDWNDAQDRFFAEGGVFDQIQKRR
jgi:sulfate/thiosulfate transport system substrate-binding protein